MEKRYVLVKKNAEYEYDVDDGYHYQHPEILIRDLYIVDYCECSLYPKYAKCYKTKAAAERFKKKLISYNRISTESYYYDCEVVEIEIA